MKKPIRTYLSQQGFIHAMVFLGLFALWGYIEAESKYMILGMALSFSGALCGSIIRIIDSVNRSDDKPEEKEAGWLN